jgi:hypothetical protein
MPDNPSDLSSSLAIPVGPQTVRVESDNAAVQSVNFDANGKILPSSTNQAKTSASFSAVIKLLILIIIPMGMTVGVGLFFQTKAQENMYEQSKNILLVTAMKNVNWQDLGNVFEPVLNIPIKTKTGYESQEFLLDSGAVVSSLPREWADKIGQDLAFMKRSTFRGFGGVTSFAYQGEMVVLLGDKDVTIPVVYTEAANTKSLLGRKGFFENYSVYFNHQEKRIEIRQ